MGKKKSVNLSDFSKWKNTPAGPVLDTGIGDLIIAKVEETGNDKAKEIFDTLRNVQTFIADNILAH